MWIWTKQGFFSVVHDDYCEPDELMVRARVRRDLERLQKYMRVKVKILELAHSDYRFRMKVMRYEWENYVADAAADIDYSNVKDTLAPITKFERLRHDTMFKCWSALHNWQQEDAGVLKYKGKCKWNFVNS